MTKSAANTFGIGGSFLHFRLTKSRHYIRWHSFNKRDSTTIIITVRMTAYDVAITLTRRNRWMTLGHRIILRICCGGFYAISYSTAKRIPIATPVLTSVCLRMLAFVIRKIITRTNGNPSRDVRHTNTAFITWRNQSCFSWVNSRVAHKDGTATDVPIVCFSLFSCYLFWRTITCVTRVCNGRTNRDANVAPTTTLCKVATFRSKRFLEAFYWREPPKKIFMANGCENVMLLRRHVRSD